MRGRRISAIVFAKGSKQIKLVQKVLDLSVFVTVELVRFCENMDK